MALTHRTIGRAAAPGWRTTSSHRQPASLAGRQPWGRRHALIEEAQTTACGQSILNWPVFWHLAFDPQHAEACPDCIDALGLRPRETEVPRPAAG